MKVLARQWWSGTKSRRPESKTVVVPFQKAVQEAFIDLESRIAANLEKEIGPGANTKDSVKKNFKKLKRKSRRLKRKRKN